MLGADDRPTLLFSHVPLSGQSSLGNAWFENNPDHATYRGELTAIRTVLRDAPGRIAAFSGHVHWNSLTVVDGTPHLTLQSLSETFTTAGRPSGCSAILAIGDELLTWSVGGLDALQVTLPWPTRKSAWNAPLPPFSSRPAGRTVVSHPRA